MSDPVLCLTAIGHTPHIDSVYAIKPWSEINNMNYRIDVVSDKDYKGRPICRG